jgi:hypothetical protein
MDKKASAAVACTGILLAMTVVTASSQEDTPLYTMRMEQASSEMHFLPSAVSEFTYTAEPGVVFSYAVTGYCGEPFYFTESPCEVTIGATCDSTCWPSCGYTCGSTCGFTCNTCIATCGFTCNPTCDAITCDSCMQTCITCSSCSLTCSTC